MVSLIIPSSGAPAVRPAPLSVSEAGALAARLVAVALAIRGAVLIGIRRGCDDNAADKCGQHGQYCNTHNQVLDAPCSSAQVRGYTLRTGSLPVSLGGRLVDQVQPALDPLQALRRVGGPCLHRGGTDFQASDPTGQADEVAGQCLEAMTHVLGKLVKLGVERAEVAQCQVLRLVSHADFLIFAGFWAASAASSSSRMASERDGNWLACQ